MLSIAAAQRNRRCDGSPRRRPTGLTGVTEDDHIQPRRRSALHLFSPARSRVHGMVRSSSQWEEGY